MRTVSFISVGKGGKEEHNLFSAGYESNARSRPLVYSEPIARRRAIKNLRNLY